ncbi:MAG: two-component system sensor histidine kinase NtrB [Phycisphaerales bacterium]
MGKVPMLRGKLSSRAKGPGLSASARRASLALDPIITMDATGVIQSASESVEHVFGWTPHELFGRNVKVLIPEPRRSSLDRYLDRYRHADKGKSLSRARRFDAIRKNGTAVTIELSMSRAELPTQSEPFFIGIVRDCSGEIDLSADSPAARSKLQKLVTEQTRALATANLRLQLADRLASLGTLAAGLGHDMNNVLLPVRARLNAIEHTAVSAAALNHVKAVRRSVAYLQHLSDGLHFLAMDPVGTGEASGDPGAADLGQWWAQVGVLLKKAVPRGIRITASFSARLPAVRSGPHWLTQAVLNLLINASEAIADPRKGRIRIGATASDDGKEVRLSVADNGRGMTALVRRRAFDLFFTTKSRGMGTGLGLPLVRKVAERAGGRVELKSSHGSGSVVTLVLPAVAGSKRRATADDARPTAAVTLADARMSALVSQILLAAGAHVIGANRATPGTADIWVTEPTGAALAAAGRWRRRSGRRTSVLVGKPQKSLKQWAALQAVVVETPADFEALRDALGQAVATFGERRVK